MDKRFMERHLLALSSPVGPEVAIVSLRSAIVQYAANHERRFAAKIGDDYVLGPAWRDLCRAYHRLLDGETGRLDCATLSSEVIGLVTQAGMTWED